MIRRKILLAILVAIPALTAVLAERQAAAVSVPDLKITQFGIESGLLTVIFSKELCSCHFVDGSSLETCMQTANLPSGADKVVKVEIDENAKTVSAQYKLLANVVGVRPGPPASALFDVAHPEFGCVLTSGAGD